MRISLFDHVAFFSLLLGGLALAGKGWLDHHPEHNPWAPLDLRDRPGLATERKLVALRENAPACRAELERSAVQFTSLEPAGEGPCARPDRIVLNAYPLAPARSPTTCAVAAGLELWLTHIVKPAAMAQLGSPIVRVEHLGASSCRRLYGEANGRWSEHATGNAIDIAGFTLADGTRISVLKEWNGDPRKAAFLRRIRDGGCRMFGTVLSPDYNAAHRDHLHLDQQRRGLGSVCR